MIEYFNDIWNNFAVYLQSNDFLSAGVILGSITSVLIALKRFPAFVWKRIRRLIFYSTTVEGHHSRVLFQYLERWLQNQRKKSYRNTDAFYINAVNDDDDYDEPYSFYDNYQKNDAPKSLVYKQRDDFFFIRKSGRIIRIEKNKEKLDNAHNLSSLFYDRYTLSGFLAKNAIDNLLKEVIEYNKNLEEKEKKIDIYTNSSSGNINFVQKTNPRYFDTLYMNNQEKENILEDIQNFLKSKEWYGNRGIKWKRSYLFYGPPGNGKTSFVKCLASEIKSSISFINLSVIMSDSDLIAIFSSLSGIVVIEDIDRFFSTDMKITISGLLNVMDGVYSSEGVIYIYTTNHPEKIDTALKRTGRMDMKILFDNPNIDTIKSYVNNFYGQKNIDLKYENLSNSISMSDVQEACIEHKDNPEKAIKVLQNVSK